MKQLIKDFRLWLCRVFKPSAPQYRTRILRPRRSVSIGGQRFWYNQLVGKSQVELQKYFVSKGVLIADDEIDEIYNYINHKIVK